MNIQSSLMKWTAFMGVASGCHAVPDASRAWGMPSGPSNISSCASAGGARRISSSTIRDRMVAAV